MEVSAQTKYLRVSPKKVNRVLAVIRNKSVTDSLNILKLLPHRSAELVLKTLRSAVANAKNNNDMAENEMVVAKAVVDEGVRMKRFQAKARGRMGKIIKRTSNITITVKSKEVK